MKINSFIKQSKSVFNNNRLCIVIGNQSADLDSIVSSISLAFYLNSEQKQQLPFIPIINSSKSIIATKKPCTYFFEQMSVDLDDLIFIDDVKQESLEQVILVDHNELDKREKELNFESLVRGVVDHHIDRGGFSNVPLRLVNIGVGSNVSQIANMFAVSQRELDTSFADAMLYPILYDTNNLTQLAHAPDFEAVVYLKKFASVDPNALYIKLDELKFVRDENESVFDVLRQDYKLYDEQWAISSVTFRLAEWIRLQNNLAESIEFMKQHELFFFGILSVFRDPNSGDHRRDLVVFGDATLIRKLIEIEENLSFVDASYQVEPEPSYALFNVTKINLTRKYWQPFLCRFLKEQNFLI